MNFTISGLPVIAIGVGFVVVSAAPIWLAARMIGASYPTLLRSIFALFAGLIGTIVSAAATGPGVFILAPLSYLLSFKFVLGTSFLGALILGILAASFYAAMVHFFGAGFSVSGNPVST